MLSSIMKACVNLELDIELDSELNDAGTSAHVCKRI